MKQNEMLTAALASCEAGLVRVTAAYLQEHGGFARCDGYLRGDTLLRDLREGRGPSVIVLDEYLQDMDALTFLRALAQPGTQTPPIVVLAGSGYLAFRAQLQAAGASVCLRKPCPLETLCRRIGELRHTGRAAVEECCMRLYRRWGEAETSEGCRCLTCAVGLAMEQDEHIPLRKELLPTVSVLCGKASGSAVDSSLRRLIDRLEETDAPAYRQFKKRVGLARRPSVRHMIYGMKKYAALPPVEETDAVYE